MNANGDPLIIVEGLEKTFNLSRDEGSTRIPVFDSLELSVQGGECVVLAGPSGIGKSTLIRSIYGNYLPSGGSVTVWHEGEYVDIFSAPPRRVLDIRKRTLGYVSQFLRVIPRVSTLDLVMQPLLEIGIDHDTARARSETLLRKLQLPEAHWSLPPATFSGGEQQRVNIARSFIRENPILLLDEPTASLDAGNREIVVRLIREALDRGTAMIGIFHDLDVRDTVATRLFEVSEYAAAA